MLFVTLNLSMHEWNLASLTKKGYHTDESLPQPKMDKCIPPK